MTPALAGQITVVAIAVGIVAALLTQHAARRFRYTLGFTRGFRTGWDARGERESRGRVGGSYRAKKTPIAFPTPAHPDAQDHVDHG